MNIHVYKPKIINSSYRILPKHCRKFISEIFSDFRTALNYGLDNYSCGFRVFHQFCYEWHEPVNELLAKIENVKKDFEKT